MTATGSVSAQGNITSRDIITGLKIDKLTVVLNNLEELARLISRPEATFRMTPAGELVVSAGESEALTLPSNQVEAFKQLPRAVDLAPAERQRVYAAWLVTRQPQRPVQRVAARGHYVPLSGHFSWDWKEELLPPQLSWLRPRGEGPERRLEREPLADVAEAVRRFPAFVLLGPPGSGKTTVLERLVYTTARDFLSGQGARLPLLISLAGYRWERQLPLEFVRESWTTQALDEFIDLARRGRLLLLIDGLNEMARLEQPEERSQRAAAWQGFLDDYFAEDSPYSSRAIIASRDAEDYEQRLGLPRVEIDPLNEAQIEQFARAYLAGEAGNFLAALRRLDLYGQAGSPFALYILTQLYDPGQGSLPPNRGRLLAEYAARLLSLMYPYRPKELQAALLALAELGYGMQAAGEGTVLPVETLKALLPEQVQLPGATQPVPTPPDLIFNYACRAGLLSLADETQLQFKFSHQLLQEQFAAQQLLARWQASEALTPLWRTGRTPAEMDTPQVGEWDPLPLPTPTGWEQTTILAAGLAARPDAFIQAVLAVNPALAGRCLSEGKPVVAPETQAAVQQALLRDLQDPALHRRARLQAGRALAQVGDPRLEPLSLNGSQVILPDLVRVAGGTATLGSAAGEAYGDEQPVHSVEIAPFYLARWPVTNAEYRCFIEAGGYQTEDYWTPAGWQWRQGQSDTSGPVEQLMESYHYFKQQPEALERLLREGLYRPQEVEAWRALLQQSEAAARAQIEALYPVEAHEQPHFWHDPAYNSPNQPVVGVTWYEAAAYCAWLNEQVNKWLSGEWTNREQVGVWADIKSKTENPITGTYPAGYSEASQVKSKMEVRLPTEAEWEWAAGGPAHTPYPWGDEFDRDRANTLEGRVLQTTPVGAYPAGQAACGALDMSGNVWEWTHSLYQDYPYHPDDGREDLLAEGRRTLRGGAWDLNQRDARVSSRNYGHPGNLNFNVGFRVVLAPVLT